MRRVHFPVFIESETPACGMIPPTFRVHLPTATSLVYIIPHRQAERFVSMVTLNLAKLTIRTNH